MQRLARGESLSVGPRTAGGLAVAAAVLAFSAMVACAVALERALRLDDINKQIQDDIVLACSISIAVTGIVVILGAVSAHYAYQGYKARMGASVAPSAGAMSTVDLSDVPFPVRA